MTASSPRPAAPDTSCGCDADLVPPHPAHLPRTAAPDTTGGELRQTAEDGRLRDEMVAVLRRVHIDHAKDVADVLLTEVPALRDLLAERDKLAAQAQAARNLHTSDEGYCTGCSVDCEYCEGDHRWPCPTAKALGATGGGQ